MVKANRRILSLQSTLESTRKEAATLKADYAIEVTHLQRDKSDLQFTLETTRKQAAALKADYDTEVTRFQRDKSDLQLTLETTRKQAASLKADYDTEVTRFQLDKSDLQAALGALKMEVAEGKQRLSTSIGDFKQWMRDSSVDADTLIPDLDPSNSSSDIYQVLAHNALLKLRSEIWSSAYEDANKVISRSLIRVHCPLIRMLSLSSFSRQPWVILPKLSHKSE